MLPLLASPAYWPPAPRLGAFRPPAPLAPLLTAWELLAVEPSTDAERGAQRAIRTAAEIFVQLRAPAHVGGAPSELLASLGLVDLPCANASAALPCNCSGIRVPAARRRRHGGGGSGSGGGARPAPMPTTEKPPSQETFLTTVFKVMNPGYYGKTKEEFNTKVRDKGGPANDEEWTDIGIEGDDSGRLTMWPGSKLVPSNKKGSKGEMNEDTVFGPGNSVCMKVLGPMWYRLFEQHFWFWVRRRPPPRAARRRAPPSTHTPPPPQLPFAFDYIVAPFMGVFFYCAFKGPAMFEHCMSRVYSGTQPPPYPKDEYGNSKDPWAAIAPPGTSPDWFAPYIAPIAAGASVLLSAF